MSDHVSIRGLRLQARIGVSVEERKSPQAIVVDIDIRTELGRAGRSDDLAHTIDYRVVAAEIAEVVKSSESKLLEHMAEEIAAVIVPIDGVQTVAVEVRKPGPLLPWAVDAVGVRIERSAP